MHSMRAITGDGIQDVRSVQVERKDQDGTAVMTGGDRLARDRLLILPRAIALTLGIGVVLLVVKSLKGVICE